MTTVTRTFTSADCGICVVSREAHAASIFALGLVAAAKLLVEKDSTFMPPLCPGCRRIFEETASANGVALCAVSAERFAQNAARGQHFGSGRGPKGVS